jgi:DNA-directed RNA polymerase specialized sigma24 family protein
MSPPAGEITRLLHAWSAGDRSVEERLFRLVLPELRNLARALMRRERRNHTLQPTELLNEAYVRLLAAAGGTGRAAVIFFSWHPASCATC